MKTNAIVFSGTSDITNAIAHYRRDAMRSRIATSGIVALVASTNVRAGMVDPVALMANLVWLPVATILFGLILWWFCRHLMASRRKAWFPALLAFLAAFLLTPMPNADNEYVLSAVVWVGALFFPLRFWSSLATAFIACSIMTAALWSILSAAGKLTFRAGS
jgi:hypothetical protein